MRTDNVLLVAVVALIIALTAVAIHTARERDRLTVRLAVMEETVSGIQAAKAFDLYTANIDELATETGGVPVIRAKVRKTK